MKVLAIGAITKAPTPEQSAQVMPREVPATLQLYLDEKIDQFWFRHDKQGVVFLLNAQTIDEGQAILARLPLVEGGFLTFDFVPVGPLAPLGRLIPQQ